MIGNKKYVEPIQTRHSAHTVEAMKKRTLKTFPDTIGPRARRHAATPVSEKTNHLKIIREMPFEIQIDQNQRTQTYKGNIMIKKESSRYRILLGLGTNGAATKNQLRARHARTNPSTLDSSLKVLKRKKLIEFQSTGDPENRRVSITEAGKQLLLQHGDVELDSDGSLISTSGELAADFATLQAQAITASPKAASLDGIDPKPQIDIDQPSSDSLLGGLAEHFQRTTKSVLCEYGLGDCIQYIDIVNQLIEELEALQKSKREHLLLNALRCMKTAFVDLVDREKRDAT